MDVEDRREAVDRLLLAAYGLTAEQVSRLPSREAERMCAGRLADIEFANAIEDFVTIIATTDCIPSGEERLRVALIMVVQTILAHDWNAASLSSDEDFERQRDRLRPWAFRLLALLRAKRRRESETEIGRMFMLHGTPYPTQYREPTHQEMFESVLQLAREDSSLIEAKYGSPFRRDPPAE